MYENRNCDSLKAMFHIIQFAITLKKSLVGIGSVVPEKKMFEIVYTHGRRQNGELTRYRV